MLSFPCNAWFYEECEAHLKMLMFAKINIKSPNVLSLSKNGEEKEETILSNAGKNENEHMINQALDQNIPLLIT